ncbi:MAG: threonine ammonia-lyase [Desulfobacterales bacterium]|jgi:threonine dehydratase|nr:threonine ammonia-lyase [Desulfobacterales bacterium]MDY0377530.1 threonine ammonia-lyase [Desulfobacterales bacterium]
MHTIESFKQARSSIREKVIRTPLVHSPTLSRMFGGDIYLKLENLQKTGSFKIRGAAFKIEKCRNRIGPQGVVAASAGNHAQGVSLAAGMAGIPAAIVMPQWASISKQQATLAYGGRLILWGASIKESLQKARQMAEQGMTFIHPFDDPDVIAGQGTIALEILEDIEETDTIIAPVGGGGLISGIAAAAKMLKPEIRIIGVQAAACPAAHESFSRGRIVQTDSRPSIADGISVRQMGELTFQMVRQYVDDIVLVEEEQIASAIVMLLERKKILAEGAGAAPLAALFNRAVRVPAGGKVVLVISGGNVDSPLLGRIISQGMLKNGRIMRFGAILADSPGVLARLLDLVAGLEANVLHIHHDRNLRDLPIYYTRVELEIETRGSDHIQEISTRLRDAGYRIELR